MAATDSGLPVNGHAKQGSERGVAKVAIPVTIWTKARMATWRICHGWPRSSAMHRRDGGCPDAGQTGKSRRPGGSTASGP